MTSSRRPLERVSVTGRVSFIPFRHCPCVSVLGALQQERDRFRKVGAQRQVREMSCVVGHIRTHAGKQNESNISSNHKLCVYGRLGHSDSDHMSMQLCI